MAFLNPRKWNLACWVLLLFWLYPSVLMNAPMEPSLDEWESSGKLADGTRFTAYDPEFLVGWPIGYLQIATKGSEPSVRTYNFLNALINCILVTATLIALIYAVQNWIPQFSIRTLLIGVAVISLLITIGKAVFSTESYDLQTGFVMAVYFSPIVAALAYLVYDGMRRLKQLAG
jgi:hypothetical protein